MYDTSGNHFTQRLIEYLECYLQAVKHSHNPSVGLAYATEVWNRRTQFKSNSSVVLAVSMLKEWDSEIGKIDRALIESSSE